MSLLAPTTEVVKVYRWDDVGAPTISRTANSLINVFNQCLVTGYGSKVSAGWVAPFTNVPSKAVFKVDDPAGAEQYYLRLDLDTGYRVKIRLLKSMTDIDTGVEVVAPTTNFNYGAINPSGKWVLIASSKGVWFFSEGTASYGIPTNKSGSYFFAGRVPSDLGSGFWIKYTGGTYSDADSDRRGLTTADGNGGANQTGIVLDFDSKAVTLADPIFLFDGNSVKSTLVISAPLFVLAAGKAYRLPMQSPSDNGLLNFAVVDNGDGLLAMNFGTSPRTFVNNTYVPTDKWVY